MALHTSARNGTVAGRHLLWAATAAAALTLVPLAQGQVAPAAPNPPAVAAAPPPQAVAPKPVTPPAVVEIQNDLAQKQYAAAIRGASKLLALRGDAAAGFSRFQVTMLKGDAQAGAHALSAAKATYHDALRETRDPTEQALATWTAELFRRARGTAYVPHVAGAGAAANNVPLDLTDPDGRRAAFAALLDDELSVMGPQLKQAAGSPSLPQILPVVKRVQSLTELDQIANGSDARTSVTAAGLLDHARNLMSNALKGMWTRTGDIYSAATQTVTGGGTAAFINGQPVQQTVTGQNGLTGSDANELRAMVDTCGNIRDAANVFAPLAHGGDDKGWGAILNDANRVAGRAKDVLNANYSAPTVSTQYPGDTTGIGGGIGGLGVNSNVYYPPGTGGNVYGGFPTNGGFYPPFGNGRPPRQTPTTPPAGGGTTPGGGTSPGGGTPVTPPPRVPSVGASGGSGGGRNRNVVPGPASGF